MSASNDKTPTPAEVREQRKLLRRIGLAKDKRLLESLLMWDDFGGSDLWDRIRPLTNDGGEAWLRVPPNVPSDRRHGADWPVWRNQQELDAYRQESRIRAASNSYAIGLLKNLTNTVVGKGFAYKAQALGDDGKPVAGDDLAGAQKAEVQAVQRVIDGFLRANNWNGQVSPEDVTDLSGSRERELYRTRLIDGEAFLRFHGQNDGKMLVRVIDAAQVRDGAGYTQREGWTYGKRHQMEPFEDVETTLEYAVYWSDPTAKGGQGDGADDKGMFEIVPASEVLHIKGADTPSTVKRGLPLLIFDVGKSLDRAAKLQRNASIGAAIRAAVAETHQWEQATQAQISSMAAALAERQRTNPTTGRTTNVERIDPGTVRRVPTGFTKVPQDPEYLTEHMAGVQGDLQQACAGAGMASFVIGDVSSGNYSNYESASFPPVQNAACEQEYFKTAYGHAVWKAVKWAAKCGLLKEGVEERVTIQVEAPAVLHRNELEKAQEDQIGVQSGWKDRQTCAAERGLDWKQVQANNDEYAEQQGGVGGQLPMPGDEEERGVGDPPAPKPPAVPKPGVPKPPKTPSMESLAERHGPTAAAAIYRATADLLEGVA